MRNFKEIKEKVVQDAKDLKNSYNKKDINHLGILLAVICVFLAVLIPIVITNNEVKEAQAAAAEAQRIAFEEARQAAIEAEKKAEEERIAALNAALRQEQAQYEAQKAEEEARAKAEKEREELVASIKESVVGPVQSMIDSYSSEDFSTQYSIQKNLIDTQSEAVSGYEGYVSNLLALYDKKNSLLQEERDEKRAEMDKLFSEKLEYLHEAEQKRIANEEAQKEAEKKALQDKWDSHYLRTNRLSLTASKEAIDLSFMVHSQKLFSFGLKTGFILDEDYDLLVLSAVGLTLKNDYEYNFGLEANAGIVYRIDTQNILTAFGVSGVFRYTVKDGFEFSFNPGLIIETEFQNEFNLKPAPLSFGVSFTF